MKAKYLIQKNFSVISPNTGTASIKGELLNKGFLVVIDRGKLIGILTPENIIKSPYNLVMDCLSDRPWIDSDQNIDSVLKVMRESGFTVLPVFSNNEFLGTIQQADVLDYIATQKNELEEKIRQRTAELKQVNDELINEISERKKAENERYQLMLKANQTQKMDSLGTLASGIAHDFNNILAAIIGYSELALDDLQGDHPARNNIIEITKAAAKAEALIRQILTFSRKNIITQKPLSVNKIINDAISILNRTLPKMVKLDIKLNDQIKPTLADVNQLEQVILNLSINASDAISGTGTVTIKTDNASIEDLNCDACGESFSGEFVLIEIQDTGSGIRPEHKVRIFDPFFTTKEIGKGTGLGLATVFGIVKGHGGHITCCSQIGSGSTFCVYLPVVEPGIERKIKDTSKIEVNLKGNETILVVDDEATILDIVNKILTQNGYYVLTANSGEKALDVYRENFAKIDAVLMDLGMPGMGGKACFEKMRQSYPDCRVIISSGNVQPETKDKLEALGVAGITGKPFRRVELLKMIRKVLGS